MRKMLCMAVLCLAGCATQTPQQAVFQAKSAHEAALTVAVAYRKLPPCSAKQTQPCSDKAIVTQLQKADKTADAALDAAETTVRTPGFGESVINSAVAAAQAALKAFEAITANLRTK